MEQDLLAKSIETLNVLLKEVAATNSLRMTLQHVQHAYQSILPGSCFCLWLYDTNKHRFCRWLYHPKDRCIAEGKAILPGDTQPLSSWIKETVANTVSFEDIKGILPNSTICSHRKVHYLPLPRKGRSSLLLTICLHPEGEQTNWFFEFLNVLTYAALQSIERARGASDTTLLTNIANLAHRAGDKSEFLKLVTREIKKGLAAKGCSIFLYEDEQQKLVLGETTGIVSTERKPLGYVEYKIGEGLTGWIGKNRRPVRLFDAKDTKELLDIDQSGNLKAFTKSAEDSNDEDDLSPRQFLGLPILIRASDSHEDKLIGVLRLHKKQYGVAFFPHDEELGQALCDLIAPAIERWNLSEMDSKLTDSLLEVIGDMHSEKDLTKVLGTIVQKAKIIFEGFAAALFLRDPVEGVLKIEAAIGYEKAHVELELLPHQGLVGHAASKLATVAVTDVTTDARYYQMSEKTRSEICTPIILNGECYGVLCIDSDRLGKYRADDIRTRRLIESFAKQAAVAIQRFDLEAEQSLWQQNLVRTTQLLTVTNVASGLAHELKNGLAAIVGLAEAVERDPSIKAKKSNIENLEGMRRHARDLFDLAKRLMDMSKVDEARKQKGYLNSVIGDALKLLEPVIRDKKISYSTYLDPALSRPLTGEGTMVEMDPRHISQVFTNLVLNALDASFRGQRIEIRTQNSTDRVSFTVRDFGSGIQLEDKRRIFDMFFTTKSNGFGIGLHVARLLVRQHGGEINLDSKPGAGTAFTVWLPK